SVSWQNKSTRRPNSNHFECQGGTWKALLGGKNWSRRRGSNPHGTKYHWILSPARLPVPPLRAFFYQHNTRAAPAQPLSELRPTHYRNFSNARTTATTRFSS